MGGLLSKPKTPAPPPIKPPAPMPDPEDRMALNAKKKEAAMRAQKGGRESTTALGEEYGL